MNNREETIGSAERDAAVSDLREWVKPDFRQIELGTAAGSIGNETPTDGYSNT